MCCPVATARSHFPIKLAALVLAALPSATRAADEPALVVYLKSGRQIQGQLDPTTGAEQLVLAATHGGITLRRAVRWQHVALAIQDGNSVTVEALRLRAASANSNLQPRQLVLHTLRSVKPQNSSSQTFKELPPPPIAYIKFDAAIANWDGDVETDGLVVDLEPLDNTGALVAAGATVEVELFAPQRRAFDHAPLASGATIELVERWTRSIEPRDYAPSGIRLRLPFGAIHPELRPDWTAWHYGLVHVRLAAPGHGVFDASRDGVRIVPWAPNRDRLEMQTGQRFLWTERLNPSP